MGDNSKIIPKCKNHPYSPPKYVAVSAGMGEMRCSLCDELLWETNFTEQSEKQAKKAVVVPKLPPSPAQDYFQPPLYKVATKIEADDPMFIPKYQEETASVNLIANMPDKGSTRLPLRGSCVVDCGFSMELPAGYKAEITPHRSRSSRGLIVTNAPGQIGNGYRGRVEVLVLNAGNELIVINHGDCIAQMSVSPVYLFDWVTVSETQRGADGFGSTGRQ